MTEYLRCFSYTIFITIGLSLITPSFALAEDAELILANLGWQWKLQVTDDGMFMIGEDGVAGGDDQMVVDSDFAILGTATIDGDLIVTGQVDPQTVDFVPGNKVTSTGESRYYEGVSSPVTNKFEKGENYVGFKAPDGEDAIPANQIWKLPSADGASGQVLSTDGAGALGWADNTGGAEVDPTVNPLGKAVLSCSMDEVVKFDGTNWICASDADTDTQLLESQVDAFVDNNGYLTLEADGDPANELQTLKEVYGQGGATGNDLQLTASNGDVRIYNDDSNLEEVLFLDESSGRVGVGTTTPAHKLHISMAPGGGFPLFASEGAIDFFFDQELGVGGNFVMNNRNPGSRQWSIRNRNDGRFMIRDDTIGAGDRLVIDTSGDVGIGSSSPHPFRLLVRQNANNFVGGIAVQANGHLSPNKKGALWGVLDHGEMYFGTTTDHSCPK